MFLKKKKCLCACERDNVQWVNDMGMRGEEYVPRVTQSLVVVTSFPTIFATYADMHTTRLSLCTWPHYGGATFCRTCEVEGPLYLYSTLLGRGWPCYHVLEGPTDFKGVVLKVWTCGLGGGGPTDKRGHRYTPNLLFHCGFSPFLQTLICLVWSHSPVFRRNYCIFLCYHKYGLFP